ncbi:MAG: hypothetical protein FK733_04465 [Asgard group archaeon]|nr:hypothetical protein [Asgard group archaeon]
MDQIEISENETNLKKPRFRNFLERKGMVDFSLALLANFIVGPIALAIYFPLNDKYRILGDTYNFHAVLTFMCFTILPCLYLFVEQIIVRRSDYLSIRRKNYLYFSTKKGLSPKNIVNSLLQGLLMHAGLFYPWVVLSQEYMPGVTNLRYFFFDQREWALYMFFVTLNVIMMEYYTKAFIQIQAEETIKKIKFASKYNSQRIGKWVGFALQFLVWMGGHWLELTWLPAYMGFANAFFFVMISGLLTGYTVYKTENIFGVTIGHILLNVFITATYRV